MPQLIFVNRYFYPDHSATSQIVSDLAFHLAECGRDVHAVTSRQSYDNPQAALPQRDRINGVEVHRIASTQFGRSALLGRSIDYLSFYRSVRAKLAELAGRGDIVVVKTDPPLLSVAVTGPVKRNGAWLINWLQDIYPETAAALGVPFIRGPVGSSLTSLRDRSLRDAAATVVLGELMAQRVAHGGVARDRIHVIANWCNDEAIRPLAAEDNPLRREWNLGDKFVVGYSGNLGRAHEFGTILAAAERLRDDARYVFLMIGGGKQFEKLVAAVADRRLAGSFLFEPYQDSSQLRSALTLPDVHWLSLNPKLEGMLLPSKFYGIAAAGKPMIFIGDTDGEVARLLRRHGCGIAVAPGDDETLADTLRRWSSTPSILGQMGEKARAMLESHYSRQQQLARWRALLDKIAEAGIRTAGS